MPMRCPKPIFAAPVALACMAAGPPVRAEEYSFRVFCNGSPVGYQHVEVSRNDDQTVADTDVAVDVTMAGIELYRFRHRSHEIWREGKLVDLHSETDDDGDSYALSVHPDDDGALLVQSNDGSRKVPADILPTSYWNPAVLDRGELLDTESGKTLKVAVSRLSDGRYDVSGDLSVQLDYRDGRWSGVRFRYFGADVDFRPDQSMVMRAQ